MTTGEILETRHETQLKWVEPWKAIGPEGNELYSHVEMRATAHDCINLMRASWQEKGRNHAGRDSDLLMDFIAVHWATVAQSPQTVPPPHG
jgi:hypothetical protein